MRSMIVRVLLLSLLTLPLAGQTDPSALEGEWVVDLRPTPDADEYLVESSVSRIEGAAFEGRFYGTKIRDARISSKWGEPRFAFTTEDGQTEYHTSGKLRDDGRLEGTTHAPGRGFLAVWTAVPKE